jgi:hypothetical protein
MNHLQRLTNLRLDREASKKRTREQAQELFESMHALSKKGTKNTQLARNLGIQRRIRTRWWLRWSCPTAKGKPRVESTSSSS